MSASTNLEIHEILPKQWFIAKGSGNSAFGHEGGSLQMAMQDAGIENINLNTIGYSLPIESSEIATPSLTGGCIMPAITSLIHGLQGEIITAGIAFGKVIDNGTGEIKEFMLCKNTYFEHERYARKLLLKQLNYMFELKYDTDQYSIQNIRLVIQETQVGQPYGTAFVAICFKSSFYPVLGL